MAKFVFSEPQRIMLRLKKDLAEELNTNFIEEEDIFEDLDS